MNVDQMRAGQMIGQITFDSTQTVLLFFFKVCTILGLTPAKSPPRIQTTSPRFMMKHSVSTRRNRRHKLIPLLLKVTNCSGNNNPEANRNAVLAATKNH